MQWIPLWADKLTGGTQASAKALSSMLSSGGAILGCFAGCVPAGGQSRTPRLLSAPCAPPELRPLHLAVPGLHRPMAPRFSSFASSSEGSPDRFTRLAAPLSPRTVPDADSGDRARGSAIISGGCSRLPARSVRGQLVSYYGGSYARMGTSIIPDLSGRGRSGLVRPRNAREAAARLIFCPPCSVP